MKRMTDSEYVRNGGVKCPFCRSKSIYGDSVEIDAGSAWQRITCVDCDRSWNDVYSLNGYEPLDTNKAKPNQPGDNPAKQNKERE